MVGYYRMRNHHRSLEYAIEKEKWWAENKPDEDEEDYGEEYGDEDGAGEEGGEEGAADGAGEDEEE